MEANAGPNEKYSLISILAGIFLLCPLPMAADPAMEHPPEDFYRQSGSDDSFAEILEEGNLPRGKASQIGVSGSKIRLNQSLFREGPNAGRKIPREISIHTLGSTKISRQDFDKWSRWYQEDGNTQIFRLFEGEENCANDRPLAARIEAFANLGPASSTPGEWNEWVGTYTLIKPHGAMIFQSKNTENDWSVSINMNDEGDIQLNHRIGEDRMLARKMVGRPFHLRVRDNGLDYEVYVNGHKMGEGRYERPRGINAFRWGMYLGANELRHEAMILVTGAEVNPRKVDESGLPNLSEEPGSSSSQETESMRGTQTGEQVIPERTWTNTSGTRIVTTAKYIPGEDRIALRVRDQWVEIQVNQLSDSDRAFLQALGDKTQ